jgi:hypothetical protein
VAARLALAFCMEAGSRGGSDPFPLLGAAWLCLGWAADTGRPPRSILGIVGDHHIDRFPIVGKRARFRQIDPGGSRREFMNDGSGEKKSMTIKFTKQEALVAEKIAASARKSCCHAARHQRASCPNFALLR